jgi:hypothetical protein
MKCLKWFGIVLGFGLLGASFSVAAPPDFLQYLETTVINDETNPVNVREVGIPVIQLYQEDDTTNTQFIVGTSTLGLEMSQVVPEGKRLVVQHVSVSVSSQDPDLDMRCATFGGIFDGKFGRITPSHALMLGAQYRKEDITGRTVGRDASQPITLYIDEGLSVEIGCFFSRALSSSDNVFMQGSVTGYLIDIE